MKNNIKYIIVIFVLAFSTILVSCGGDKRSEGDGSKQNKTSEKHSENDGEDIESGSEEEGLHLTKEQIETIGLELGEFSSIKVNDYVKATGKLGLPPNAYASVSAKSEGIINGTKKFVEGNYIKKGALIAYIENPDFIIKQQEYLEAKAQLKLKNLDLIRQQSLVDANAGVSKNLQSTQAEVAILEAKSIGLSKQLSYLGISTTNLTPNSINKQIALVAPMSGYISSINLHNGMYAQPTVSLMEIISEDHLHLELDVFEKDISKIKIEQKISYTIPALGNTIYDGEVTVIGKEFDTKNKTIRIHGHLEGKKPLFLKGLFINAKIWLNDNTSIAIPEDAIIKDGKSSFIYVAKETKDKTEFNKIMVISGVTNNGFTSIKVLDEIPEGMKIVVKGAYYVYAQSKAGELEDDD
ncbi:MAG: efflux transporter periplasmic adaptor subunit [Bacteroidales bacterium]|nr:MAG: efflux transporter periplasmic adaptor subunit [Bacteroidales bacterium]